MGRRIRKRERTILGLMDLVTLARLVAVRGKDVLHRKARAMGLALGLLHALQVILALSFGFDHHHARGLGMLSACTHNS